MLGELKARSTNTTRLFLANVLASAIAVRVAVTALFFAAMLGANTEGRVAALMRGCMVAGVIAALAGVAAYFKLIPGSRRTPAL